MNVVDVANKLPETYIVDIIILNNGCNLMSWYSLLVSKKLLIALRLSLKTFADLSAFLDFYCQCDCDIDCHC